MISYIVDDTEAESSEARRLQEQQVSSDVLYKQLKEEALSVTLIDESDYDVPLEKGFNWEITAFKPKSLEIQLNFTEPLAISEGEESDRIKVSFKKTELLYDEYGQALDTGTEIESYVPA